jgi:surface protein
MNRPGLSIFYFLVAAVLSAQCGRANFAGNSGKASGSKTAEQPTEQPTDVAGGFGLTCMPADNADDKLKMDVSCSFINAVGQKFQDRRDLKLEFVKVELDGQPVNHKMGLDDTSQLTGPSSDFKFTVLKSDAAGVILTAQFIDPQDQNKIPVKQSKTLPMTVAPVFSVSSKDFKAPFTTEIRIHPSIPDTNSKIRYALESSGVLDCNATGNNYLTGLFVTTNTTIRAIHCDDKNVASPVASVTYTFSTAFISTWDTRNTSAGSSPNDTIKLPTERGGTYDAVVKWGDGIESKITGYNQGNQHQYSRAGVYTIEILGIFNGFKFGGGGDALKLLNISQFGILRLGNTGSYFSGAENLKITATDPLDLTGTTDLSLAFERCVSLETVPSIGKWNTSQVTNMHGTFKGATLFNQDLNNWDTGNVERMSSMFLRAASFNQPIGSWNTQNVTDMSTMFMGATRFNQDLNRWNTTNVTQMHNMFWEASAFNGLIVNWNTAKVETMLHMFYNANAFNQPIGVWNTQSVKNMSNMFSGASAFNQYIGGWNISKVTDMESMFYNVSLSQTNYDNLLSAWSLQIVQPNVTFNAGTSKYTASSQAAKDILTNGKSWIIYDGGVAP